ncbi:uncharacterized protein BO80DRAFT_442130 [Aspergillus ibericus CBS 121593]|uniref:Uncharacterized protein n=1 Tax=Aspergillus ibericus CBS 121593 TaxID=1448316 RepID=A0A395H983_9EURO|nr:hypothetical protein BO80DRAFT_442130 [Aspergillus ibericus CBS 121593]RAL04129.1 hypothetical protein BO80DRAFT_442130 [Aspergillus ibericus CBS 121593]
MKLAAVLCLLGASIAIATPHDDARIKVSAHSRRDAVLDTPMNVGDSHPPPQFDPQPHVDGSRPRIGVTEASEGGVHPRNADPEPEFEETRPRITRSDWPPPI